MIVVSKIIDSDGEEHFYSHENEEQALQTLELYDKDYELLVDFAELKNYKAKYEEIYKVLFESFTQKEKKVETVFENTFFTVKYIHSDEQAKGKTFTSLEQATEWIDEMNRSSDEYFSAQILVNIAEIKDYKDKYEEFYQLMLENYKKEESY